MKWIAISGSWRKMNKELETDVRKAVREVMSRSDGIVSCIGNWKFPIQQKGVGETGCFPAGVTASKRSLRAPEGGSSMENIVPSEARGLCSGGALNVDYIALDEALKLNPTADKIKIFIPATLDIFSGHYRKRAKEGVITEKQAEELIGQLNKLKQIDPSSLVENKDNKIIDKAAYYQRNSAIIELADELIAFWVNQSLGTKDAIDKARQKGIPVKVFEYTIESVE